MALLRWEQINDLEYLNIDWNIEHTCQGLIIDWLMWEAVYTYPGVEVKARDAKHHAVFG